MKLATATSKGFRPFELKITVETNDELEILWAILNTPDVDQIKHLHQDADVLISKFKETSKEIFNAIDFKREEYQK